MAAIDPGALYNQTLADLNQSAAWEEGKITEGEGDLRSNVGYAEAEITRGEPGAYRTESNAANKGGILSSGINAQRKTDLANSFAAKRTANALRLEQGLQGFKRQREGVGLTKIKGEHLGALNFANAQNAYQAANPTVPVPTGTTGVPGSPGVKPLQFGFNEAIRKEKQGFFKGPSRKIRI